MPEYRSVSQHSQYNRCPRMYYLSRVARDPETGDRLWQRPAAWLPQGSAWHVADETWEKSGRTMTLEEVQDVFRTAYAEETAKYTDKTPNFQHWSWSGPYNGEKDIERRYNLGLEQTARYVEYYTNQAPHEVPWVTPQGELAVEIGFEVDLDGVEVRGFIDMVLEDRVRDNKSGKMPGDDFQLATYKIGLKKKYGKEINVGDYFMGRTGRPTVAYKLGAWTEERVTEEYHKLDENIRAERFDPDPEPDKCKMCSVNHACDAAIFS